MASKVAADALSTVVSSVPSTMTPFLYQTRTLSSLHCMKSRHFTRLKSLGTRRNLSEGIARRVKVRRVDPTATSTTHEKKDVVKIRRTSIMRGIEPQFSGDFYGTTTGSRRVAGSPPTQPSIMRTVYQPVDVDGQSDMPWVTDQPTNRCVDGIEPVDEADDVFSPDDSLFDDQNEVDAWTRKSDPSQDRQTTITPSERAAFEEIFKNIRKKTLNAQRYGVLDEDDAPVYVNRKEATHKLESLMGSAMKERFPTTRDEKETVINRYPPSLRALAAQAVGLDYDESHFEETAKEEAMKNDQLEELRQPVREKVESRMHAAETDAQLWAVMEDAVFPIIAKLGLEKAGKDKLLKKRGRKPAVAAQKGARKAVLPSEELQNVQFKPFFHNGQEVSPLAFYGPLYPSYLLLGLRLLDRSFARPSPLTLSILPKIKSLGLISHVLGASTQLYNELLIIHWYRYDDFRGVIKLLTEMEESGLSFNKETLDIISDITRMQGRILRGDRGATLKALWSLPEFAPGAFFSWHKKIKKMLDERESPAGRLSY